MRYRDIIRPIVEAIGPKNRGILKRNGKPFFSGAFDVMDGEILETHTYEQAERSDFHHSHYFSGSAIEAMSDEEAAFFWVDEKGIQTEWRQTAASGEILKRLYEQVAITEG